MKWEKRVFQKQYHIVIKCRYADKQTPARHKTEAKHFISCFFSFFILYFCSTYYRTTNDWILYSYTHNSIIISVRNKMRSNHRQLIECDKGWKEENWLFNISIVRHSHTYKIEEASDFWSRTIWLLVNSKSNELKVNNRF